MQDTLSRAENGTNGIASFPANDYDLSAEWADFERRRRLLLLGRITPSAVADFWIGLTRERAIPGN